MAAAQISRRQCQSPVLCPCLPGLHTRQHEVLLVPTLNSDPCNLMAKRVNRARKSGAHVDIVLIGLLVDVEHACT